MGHPYPDIALIGPPGSGKSEVSRRWGKRLGFSHALKEECARALFAASGITDPDHLAVEAFIQAQEETDKLKELYRPLWQWWGTEYRRANDKNYWVRQVERQIDEEKARDWDLLTKQPLAVDDCRFPNEYDLLKSRGFKFVRLHGGEHERNFVPHQSEHHWRDFPVDVSIQYMQLDDIVPAIKEALA